MVAQSGLQHVRTPQQSLLVAERAHCQQASLPQFLSRATSLVGPFVRLLLCTELYPQRQNSCQPVDYMVIKATDNDSSSIVLGDEGQGLNPIALDDVRRGGILFDPQAVPKQYSQPLPWTLCLPL